MMTTAFLIVPVQKPLDKRTGSVGMSVGELCWCWNLRALPSSGISDRGMKVSNEKSLGTS